MFKHLANAKQSELKPYIGLPSATEYGVITVSVILERMLMAALKASRTSADLSRGFVFGWDTLRLLTNIKLSDYELHQVVSTELGRNPMPCMYLWSEDGCDIFPILSFQSIGEKSGVALKLNDYFASVCVPGGHVTMFPGPPLYDMSMTRKLHTALSERVEEGTVVLGSDIMLDLFTLAREKPRIAFPNSHRWYKNIFLDIIVPSCIALSGISDIRVCSVEPAESDWRSIYAKAGSTRFVVERQEPVGPLPEVCLGTPYDVQTSFEVMPQQDVLLCA